MTTQDWTKDDIAYGIDGGYMGIYDGIIVWVLEDGRHINRFAGEGSRRERRVDQYILELGAPGEETKRFAEAAAQHEAEAAR